MIRQATPEDAEAIAVIHVQTWRAAYAGILPADFLAGLSEQKRAQFWQKQLTENRSLILVAVEEDRVVGWVAGGVSRDPETKAESEVHAIYVSVEYWACGLGRQLMKKIEEGISTHSDIILWVLAHNQRAIGFYRKIGYEFDGGEKTVQLGDVYFQEIRLRKKEPINALEPTATPVTPPACAGAAPAASVALGVGRRHL